MIKIENDRGKETELSSCNSCHHSQMFFCIIMQEIHHAFPIKYLCNLLHRRAVVFSNSLVLVLLLGQCYEVFGTIKRHQSILRRKRRTQNVKKMTRTYHQVLLSAVPSCPDLRDSSSNTPTLRHYVSKWPIYKMERLLLFIKESEDAFWWTHNHSFMHLLNDVVSSVCTCLCACVPWQRGICPGDTPPEGTGWCPPSGCGAALWPGPGSWNSWCTFYSHTATTPPPAGSLDSHRHSAQGVRWLSG